MVNGAEGGGRGTGRWKEHWGKRQPEEHSGDYSAVDEGKETGKEDDQGSGMRLPTLEGPPPRLLNLFGKEKKGNKVPGGEPEEMEEHREEGGGNKPAPLPLSEPRSSRGEADRASRAETEEYWPEERWPGTRAPQSQAGNPEGDEERGKEVPQDWGTCDGRKQGAELPGERESLLAARAASGRKWGLRRGLSEGPLSNIGTPTTYGKQRNGSRMADEYMIKDALKAQAEASQVWIEEQEETEEQRLIEKNLKFWDELELNGSGISKDKLEEENDFAKINDDLSEQLHESCLRICIENLKKLHPEKGKRTLKKLNPDKNSDQQQQQQQQEMWVVLISIADDSSYVQTAMMDCEKQQERGKLPEGEKTYKTYQQDLGTQSGGFVLKLAIAGGLLDLFRMLGIEEGLKGEIGAEDELKAEEEEEKATPVFCVYRLLQLDLEADIGRILAPITISDLAKFTERRKWKPWIEIIEVDDEGDSESDERIRYNEALAKVGKFRHTHKGYDYDRKRIEIGTVRGLVHNCKTPLWADLFFGLMEVMAQDTLEDGWLAGLGACGTRDNRTEEQRIQDKQDRGAENSVVRIKNNKRGALVLKSSNTNNNKKKIKKNKKQYIGDLVHNIVEEEKEIAQASDNKRRMASGNSRFRRTDWAADEEVPEDIRSEPITTPDQGRRYFPRGSGRTRYEHPPETNPGSRTFGRPPSGIPRYTGNYTHQSRINPFSNQSNRPGFINNSQGRPSYQSPLDEVHPGNDRIQTPGSRGNTGIGQGRRQLTKIKPMDKRLIFDGTNVEKFIQ
ncbi:hypothetical protein PPACK8108_LOCUS12115 [Phakopsora pachyrhizi]|uniref:Uncharacterized protein n=1 Tax=Phakopsora pachyrhizi TaxID=170000 RepID=A0AAV0B2R5_PHAPC|nr:hypothetical protein PPACK8108_LOCUS12115 [Phakopsora pachyrhizi]